MSQVVPKEEAERLAFTYQPKTIRHDVTDNAKTFMTGEIEKPSDFRISPLVEQTTGMAKMKKKQLEAEVEEAVLQHVKDLEESAYKKAYELGLVEGREKSFDDTKVEIKEKLGRMDDLLKNMENLKSMMSKENEVLIVKLALLIGQKIAMRELSLSQEPIIELLRELLDSVKKDEKALIRLAQKDADFIEDLRQRNDERIDFLQNVKLVPVASIESGGCVLETNYGSIDSTIQERVGRAWEALLSRVPDLREHKTDLKDTSEQSKP